jgi:hypothetical protein
VKKSNQLRAFRWPGPPLLDLVLHPPPPASLLRPNFWASPSLAQPSPSRATRHNSPLSRMVSFLSALTYSACGVPAMLYYLAAWLLDACASVLRRRLTSHFKRLGVKAPPSALRRPHRLKSPLRLKNHDLC